MSLARVFIGLPVHNGEAFIQTAIESVEKQTFRDWKLLVSDNASTDDTQRICQNAAARDDRIAYRRFSDNQGATVNYSTLLASAVGEYFVWIASDDIWKPEFLETCVNLLDGDQEKGMAFTGFVNVDTYGQTIRTYPDFSRFGQGSMFGDVGRFLLDPEIMGKANLIYSVYRLETARKAWEASPLSDHWGADVCFVLAALSRTGLATNTRVLFRKRLVRLGDRPEHTRKIVYRYPRNHLFPILQSCTYVQDSSRATAGTRYRPLAVLLTLLRVPRAALNSITNRLMSP